MSDYRYFVMTFYGKLYQVYSTRNVYPPPDDDPRCVWLGNDLGQARQACKDANEKLKQKEAANAPRLFN